MEGERIFIMLKVVVFDSGYGGEFLADRIEEELPVIDIIRVIDWRNANKILTSPKEARRIAREDLRPYIGKVDLIIFANHLLTVTSLKYFRRKFKNQKFIGLGLRKPKTPVKDSTIILTTKAVTKTISYYNFILHLSHKPKTMTLDSWPEKIDDGELTFTEISNTLKGLVDRSVSSQEIFLFCSQFYDIKSELTKLFGNTIKIHDGFDDMIREICRILKIRGGMKKLK